LLRAIDHIHAIFDLRFGSLTMGHTLDIKRWAASEAVQHSSGASESLEGKTVYITGAAGAGALGAAIAAAFAEAKASKIALFDSREDELQQLKTTLGTKHPQTTFWSHIIDIADAPSVGIASHWARVDVGGKSY
jgi:FlaA1/EpsC-like NDP-sugar epimerase